MHKWKGFLGASSRALPLRGSNVQVLSSPSEFYSTLHELIAKSRRRIVLSSLYLGCDKKEQALVESLRQRCREEAGLDVHVLLDSWRGCRPDKEGRSSVTTLDPLLSAFPSRARLSLLRVPSLLDKLSLPPRVVGRGHEAFGVHHTKLYLFDDTLLVSGANLSELYFGPRQDRYIVLHEETAAADWAHATVDILASSPLAHSYLHQRPTRDPTKEKLDQLKEALVDHASGRRIRHTYPERAFPASPSADTFLFPALQFASIGLRHEQALTTALLTQFNREARQRGGGRLWLASGYMNLAEGYTRLLAAAPAGSRVDVLAASPSASGWYGASGPTRHVPALYARALSEVVRRLPKDSDTVRVLEWKRNGWTFHAKGLWLSDASNSSPRLPLPSPGPVLTALGSTNFGTRSTDRDLECQFFLTTSHTGLQEEFAKERDSLFSYGRPVSEESLKRQIGAGWGMEFAWRALRSFL